MVGGCYINSGVTKFKSDRHELAHAAASEGQGRGSFKEHSNFQEEPIGT